MQLHKAKIWNKIRNKDRLCHFTELRYGTRTDYAILLNKATEQGQTINNDNKNNVNVDNKDNKDNKDKKQTKKTTMGTRTTKPAMAIKTTKITMATKTQKQKDNKDNNDKKRQQWELEQQNNTMATKTKIAE